MSSDPILAGCCRGAAPHFDCYANCGGSKPDPRFACSTCVVNREMSSSLAVLHYCIHENLPETAREIGKWMGHVALELYPSLSDNRHYSYAAKPYILKNYQDETGAGR